MNQTRFSVALALAVTAGAARSDAQQASREPATLARLEQTLDADTYRAVVRVIESARARALPTDPLIDRALEGAMKRAPGARIRVAVSTLAQRLEVARRMLAPEPSEADIAAGAGALGVGVPGETLQTIRSIRPAEPVAVPLGVLTELVARSVPVDRAATLVVELIKRGATPTQLVALNDDVQRDIAAGIEPGAAFDLRTRGVASALPGGSANVGDAATAPNAPLGEATNLNGQNRPRNAPGPSGPVRRP